MHGIKIKKLVLNDGTTLNSCEKSQATYWIDNESKYEWIVILENNVEIGRYNIQYVLYIEQEVIEK